MPMTWGWRRPVILLPGDAATWGEERLRTALLHELAHVRRGDCLTQLLLRIVSAWQWFNPLSWWTLGRVRVEQERACDDLAMGSGLDPTDYAGHLLAIASGRGGRGLGFGAPSLALAMAAPSRIERRILSILDVRRNRRALSRRRAGLSAALAAALMFPLAALQLPSATAQPPAPGTANGQSAARPEQAEVLEKLRTLYVKVPDEDELRRGAIKGMIGALYDPYSEYLTPEQAADLDRQIQGKLSGIGAQLDQKEKTIRVITPLLRSPAFQAGIKAGDVILAVDGRAVEGRSLTDVVKQIVGPAGTVVQIKVRHADGREVDLALTRGPIALETVKGFRRGENQEWDHWIDPERQIGYVRVEQFGPGTPKDLDDAVRPLIERGLKGLILDLRFGSGGLMNSAIATARRFLAKGTIVSVEGRDGAVTTYRADGKETLGDFPLVVLANGQTASSAEIVAGTLKDNGRAVLVGERTFGKGSVQSIVALKDGSGALKLTTAYYTLPSGRVYDRREGKSTWGIDPTEGDYIPMAPEATETLVKRRRALDVLDGAERAKPEADPADPQLAAALKALVARLTTGEFIKVGIPASALEARMTQRAEIEKRREALLQSLRKVDQELEALDKPGP
jgi:carboxyl-terminal processing protease